MRSGKEQQISRGVQPFLRSLIIGNAFFAATVKRGQMRIVPLANVVPAIFEHSGIWVAPKEPVERRATDAKAFSQLAFCLNKSFHKRVIGFPS